MQGNKGKNNKSKSEKSHDAFQNEVKEMFDKVGMNCVIEDDGSEPGMPDLKIDGENLLIEIKEFQGSKDLQNKDKDQMREVNESLSKGSVFSYWIEEGDMMIGQLESAASKFKREKYKDYKTVVAIRNSLNLHDQHVGEQIENVGRISSSIGAIAQIYEEIKEIAVFHNTEANPERIIDKSLFEKFEPEYTVIQYEYHRTGDPKLVKI